jgi:excinuclease ABC subunit C
VEVLAAFLAQHYADKFIPGTLILNIEFDHPALMLALQEQCGHRINLVFQPQDQRRKWLELAQKGAEISLARCCRSRARSSRARARWSRRCAGAGRYRHPARRVLRHLAHAGRGHAGLVRGVPSPPDAERRVPPLQHQRHHAGRRLRRHAPGADRRYEKVANGDGVMPDVVLIDGGKARSKWRARCSPNWGWISA